MSQLGQTEKCGCPTRRSALPSRTDIFSEATQVRTVPLPEVSPRYSMTSSAVASNGGGTERPRALAAFGLMTSLNRVGGQTNPFRSVSVYERNNLYDARCRANTAHH